MPPREWMQTRTRKAELVAEHLGSRKFCERRAWVVVMGVGNLS